MVSIISDVERTNCGDDNLDGLSQMKFWAHDAVIVITLSCEVVEISHDAGYRAEGHFCYGAVMDLEVVVQGCSVLSGHQRRCKVIQVVFLLLLIDSLLPKHWSCPVAPVDRDDLME